MSDEKKTGSQLRDLIADAHGEEHVAHRSLSDAKLDPQGIVVLEGDYGGQIYLVARAACVSCDEPRLQKLLSEIDSMAWNDPDGARVCFESLPIGSGVAGGMGGGLVTVEIWLHPKLNVEEQAVRGVLSGQSSSIHQ